ncbi:MAG: hypothetical protein HZB16_01955 [Armatimonadetes bacterium]|nr:hypothetical protein [Armatimonadota bacterium]
MNARERFVAALDYDQPDRLPVVYHPCTAGLYVHGQPLADLLTAHPPDNPISFEHLPGPPAEAVDAQGRYHEFRVDGWGAEWEYLIFGVAGHPSRYPVTNWAQSDSYQLPAVPACSGPEFEAARAWLDEQKRSWFLSGGGISLFERLHAISPLEDLLLAIGLSEPGLLAFLERLEVYWHACLDRDLALGHDAIWFGDDWGTQTGPIISPAAFDRLFAPIYARLFARVKAAGARVFFHSCGAQGPIFDRLLELGIDLIWPQIGWFEADPARIEACRDRGVAFYVHPDRQRLVPLGRPDEIRAEMRRYGELGRRLGGGVVFYVEIENDAPWANAMALVEGISAAR